MSHVILSLTFGALIGFSLGLLGGGGSILTVPILVYVIGQDVHFATGTLPAIVGGSALLGAFAHSRRGNVRINEQPRLQVDVHDRRDTSRVAGSPSSLPCS